MRSEKNVQTEALRQAIEEVTENNTTETEQTVKGNHKPAEQEAVEVDILNLPPRNEVHKTNRKMRIKLRMPLLRFLFIVILLLALAGVVVWSI